MRAEGVSLVGVGILAGDLLVVDRSLEAKSGRIVIAVVNGTFKLLRLGRESGLDSDEVTVWGVVTHAIHSFPGADAESGAPP
jgi:DNA polymerase V